MSKPTAASELEEYFAHLLSDDGFSQQPISHETCKPEPSKATEEKTRRDKNTTQARLTVEPPRSTAIASPSAQKVVVRVAQASPGIAATKVDSGKTDGTGRAERLNSESMDLDTRTKLVSPESLPLAEREKTHDIDTDLTLEDRKRQRLQKMLSRRTNESLTEIPKTQHLDPEDTPALDEGIEEITEQQAGTGDLAKVNFSETQSPEMGEQTLLAWGDNGRPLWANGRFDVLLFDVSGLSLAVPLVALGQIVPLSDKLTVLHGQSEWFMGILPSHIGDIRTINTALFVMPERYTSKFLDTARYVVTIDGMSWGLAVDSVNQPITLAPEDVKWRSQRTQRPWLAGTVKSHMCALIDVPQMGALLKRADKNQPINKNQPSINA